MSDEKHGCECKAIERPCPNKASHFVEINGKVMHICTTCMRDCVKKMEASNDG